MACRQSGGSKILYCLGLFLVASCHCIRLTKPKALDKLRGNLTPRHSQTKGSELHHGRLLIGQNPQQGVKLKGSKATTDLLDVDTDYQADMGWGQPKQPKGQGDGSSRLKPDDEAVERLLKMEPKVECTGDSMKLQVQDAASTPGSLFFVDRGSRLSPLPLSKLPPSCGYTVKSTWRDLVLVAPYDGCFVALEEDSYVLPLRWLGLPVRMSCPLMRQSSPNPPMVTCHTEGMVVKTEWTISVAKIAVNLNGNWESLMKASPRCGFSVVVHPEGVVISARYAPCLEKKDGMYTLELTGDGETKISCPSLSPAQPEPTTSPAKGQKQPMETPSKGVHPSNPSYNSASAHSPEPTPKYPAQSAVPQVPSVPQIPEVPSKPNQGPEHISQPQLPYFPFHPNFFYPYPENPDTKPMLIEQTTNPPVINKNDEQQSQQTVPPAELPLNPEGQVPSFPWPAQPGEVPVEKELPQQPQSTQQPNGQEKQPLYPYPFYVKPPDPDSVPPAPRPEVKPLPATAPPIVKPEGQGWQPFYPFPIYPEPPKPEPPSTEPPVTKPPPPPPPPGKLQEHFPPNPFNFPSQPSWEQMQPSASHPEGRQHEPLYPNPFYPWPPASEAPQVQPSYPLNPEKLSPQQPVHPKPPVSEEPPGQTHQQFYPYLFLPQGPHRIPVPPTHQTPTSAPKGQVQQTLSPLQPEVSKPKAPENLSPSKPPAPESKVPPQPEAPQGQVYQAFYPFYTQPEPGNQPAVPKPPQPTQPEAPQGQVYQTFYPFYPQPEPGNQPAVPKPPQPEPPQGQVYQTFHPFYPQPEYGNHPVEKPIALPKPPQPEAPQGQVYQSFYPFYPQPQPENVPTEKPAVDPTPPATETPKEQVHKPSYPPPFKLPGAGTNGDKSPTEKPAQSEQPPAVKPPESQVPHHFKPYWYPQQPQHPQPVTLPPATYVQQPQQVTAPASGQKPPDSAIPQPSNGGIVPQDPRGSSYIPPVSCPQFCPSGFSNCCPQIAFHQHLHHIVPAGTGGKDTPAVYTGPPFFPSVAYSGFGTDFGSPPLPQASISPQSFPSGNEKHPYLQPPDGNPAALPRSNPSKPTNPAQQMYPYFVHNSLYPNWPYPPQTHQVQNIPQRRSQAHYSFPSRTQTPGNEPVNPEVQYELYNVQPPQYKSKLSKKEVQPSNIKSIESKGPAHPKVQSELDSLLVPYYMLQDGQAPTYNKSAVPSNSTQPESFVTGSKKSARHEQPVNTHPESKTFVLLQHGPPGREPNSFNEPPLLFRDVVHDEKENFGSKQHHPHNLRPPQEKPQHPKWLGSPLAGNVNYMPRPGDESERLPLLFSASDGSHFVPLPQNPSFGEAQLKSKFFDSFKDLRKPMTPLGSSKRIPPHVPGKAFQQLSSAADQQD